MGHGLVGRKWLLRFASAPPTFHFPLYFSNPQKRRTEARPPPHRTNQRRQSGSGAEPPALLLRRLHSPRNMAMAASSRLLWASRAAAYLRISTFPRAFSTGTYLTLLSVATLPSGVACRFLRSGSWDHGSLLLGRHDLVVLCA
jgi:hypothetical protein